MSCSKKLMKTRDILLMDKEDLEDRIHYQLELAKRAEEYHPFVWTSEPDKVLGPSIGIKDTIAVKGAPMTCCSRILQGHVPVYDATAYARVKEHTTLLGKTSCDSFACGSSGATSDFGVTRNAHDPLRVPGGSSGGSATALALGLVDLALGTDTFGSVRAPASFSGVVGLRPSYGLVSRKGLVDLCMSMDTIGPMARDVYGVAYLLSMIAGGKGDLTVSITQQKDYTSQLEKPLAHKHVLLLKEGFEDPVDPRIARLVEKEADKINAETSEISLSLEQVVKAYYVVMSAEFASSMQRYDGIRYGKSKDGKTFEDQVVSTRTQFLSEEVKRRILVGAAVTMAEYKEKYYSRAKKAIERFKQSLKTTLQSTDFIVCPTMPCVPWKIGEIQDPLKEYASDLLTGIASAAGLPAISVPCGTVQGLPIGLQIIGKDDESVLRVAREYEKERDKE